MSMSDAVIQSILEGKNDKSKKDTLLTLQHALPEIPDLATNALCDLIGNLVFKTPIALLPNKPASSVPEETLFERALHVWTAIAQTKPEAINQRLLHGMIERVVADPTAETRPWVSARLKHCLCLTIAGSEKQAIDVLSQIGHMANICVKVSGPVRRDAILKRTAELALFIADKHPKLGEIALPFASNAAAFGGRTLSLG